MTLSNAFISLNDIINNFLISYTGPGKLIPDAKRTEVVFHARRCLQEFAYETLKSQMEDTTTLTSASINFPSDMVVNIAVFRSETLPNTTQTPTVLMTEVSSAPTSGVDTYFVNTTSKTIVFSSAMIGYKIAHKYLSNGLTTDEAAAIPKLAEQALYSCMIYAILANRENTDANTLQRLLMEKEAMLEKSKSRLVFTSFTS
jgi:hypothetical protein